MAPDTVCNNNILLPVGRREERRGVTNLSSRGDVQYVRYCTVDHSLQESLAH